MSLIDFVERLVVPPGGFLTLMAVGWLISRRRLRAGPLLRRTGRVLMVLGFLLGWASTLPWVGAVAIRSLETVPAWEPVEDSEAEVIVVLGAGVEGETPEYGGLTLGPLSLERVRWAARLHHATGLPVAVTGGSARPDAVPVAQLMRDALEQDYDVTVRWVESESATTWENADRTRQLLSVEGVDHVVLVTHAWHMPRAILAFEKYGFDVIPSPTMFHGPPPTGLNAWIPSARALRHTSWAAHEWLGRVEYSTREP